MLIRYVKKHGGLNSLRGEKGEERVSASINRCVSEHHYLLNDLILKKNGGSHQIDHVLLTRKGIFVIETKNYSCMVYGHEEENKWCQVLSYGKVKNYFYNPIKQNMTHVSIVKNVLNLRESVFSLVIFPRAKLEINSISFAGNIRESISAIRNIVENSDDVFTDDELLLYTNTLRDLDDKSPERKAKHVAEIQAKREKIALGICPNCGGKLVLRSGKHGQFYRCSNYPSCHFKTKTLD